jgi:hypothetical protein
MASEKAEDNTLAWNMLWKWSTTSFSDTNVSQNVQKMHKFLVLDLWRYTVISGQKRELETDN